MDLSLRVPSQQKEFFEASAAAPMPGKQNCLMQMSHIHDIYQSELNYAAHRQNLDMRMLRKHEGIAAPLKICMELHSARKIGRLPFLQSSNMMEDVLLGKDETIEFSDFLNVPENSEFMSTPHVVVEKSLGIY